MALTLWTTPLIAQKSPKGIDVQINPENPLQLRIKLRSFAQVQTTIYKSELPWGLSDSIILVAVTPSGEYLEQSVVAGDPSPEKITLHPNESLSGDINLTRAFKTLEKTIHNTEINLFWAYRSPKELNLPHWSGGWILIPRQEP
ncbi:MAG TPA: hypothetical protein VFQ00_03705 [Terriglobales bacterium]|nr:hypothetical protein [Terriglobales bacterium]